MNQLHDRQWRGRIFGCVGAALLALAVWGPHIGALPGHHTFVDTRVWHGIPNAADVLSNIAFLVAGCFGFAALALRTVPLTNMQRAMTALFFAGLVLTTFTSGWYHLDPGEMRLAMDRTGMAVAFAGLLGLAAATKVGERAGACTGLAILFVAPWAIAEATRGELLPWAVLQFGGMAILLALAAVRPLPNAPKPSWLAVIAIYAIAKLCESADVALFEATRELVSGHTLKHIVAAGAALPLIIALRWHNGSAAEPTGFGIARRSPR